MTLGSVGRLHHAQLDVRRARAARALHRGERHSLAGLERPDVEEACPVRPIGATVGADDLAEAAEAIEEVRDPGHRPPPPPLRYGPASRAAASACCWRRRRKSRSCSAAMIARKQEGLLQLTSPHTRHTAAGRCWARWRRRSSPWRALVRLPLTPPIRR